jgi:hypothetical protein
LQNPPAPPDSDFPPLPFRSHQIRFLNDDVSTILNRSLSITKLSIVFQVTTAVVRKTFGTRPESPQPLGRHEALDPDVESGIVTPLLESCPDGRVVTPKALLQKGRERYNPKLTKGWVHSSLGRHLDAVELYRSVPQEDTRTTVPRAHLEHHITAIKENIFGNFSEFTFNLNEVRLSQWEDRNPRKVISPQTAT